MLVALLVCGALGSVGWAVFHHGPKHDRANVQSVGKQLPQGYTAGLPRKQINGVPSVLVRDFGGSPARFLLIDGASFTMGNVDPPTESKDEKPEDLPRRLMTISPFYLKETEVTNGELGSYFIETHVPVAERPKRWRAACDEIKTAGRDPKSYPAVGVTHAQAEDFARWAGGKLPSEAQWEFAARSRGQNYPYVWGQNPQNPKKNANLDSATENGKINTVPVGQFTLDKTEEGVCDLMGNVREWCRDRWAPYDNSQYLFNPVVEAPAGVSHTGFVIRGGSFATWADKIRTTRPRRADPDDTQELTTIQLAEDGSADDLGFRIVVEWPPR